MLFLTFLLYLSIINSNVTKMETQTTTVAKRKSERLTDDAFAALKQYAKGFNTAIECAEAIGINRVVLDRLLLVGSASPETITKVKTAIGIL